MRPAGIPALLKGWSQIPTPGGPLKDPPPGSMVVVCGHTQPISPSRKKILM